jgi:hypothetical protein
MRVDALDVDSLSLENSVGVLLAAAMREKGKVVRRWTRVNLGQRR